MHTGIRVATGRAEGDLLLIAARGLCVSEGDEGEAAIMPVMRWMLKLTPKISGLRRTLSSLARHRPFS
jgi:hypothetical protein